jgi:hypothetical protein
MPADDINDAIAWANLLPDLGDAHWAKTLARHCEVYMARIKRLEVQLENIDNVRV